jgi:hypothetical protein
MAHSPRLAELLLAYEVADLVAGISPEGAKELIAERTRLMESQSVIADPIYYASSCPETERWFVCKEGVDNNLCECFAWGGATAEDNAIQIAHAINILRML